METRYRTLNVALIGPYEVQRRRLEPCKIDRNLQVGTLSTVWFARGPAIDSEKTLQGGNLQKMSV